MFTQCPRCDATFLLSANQLKAASGDVRCGQCLSVFNALDHISEDLPPTQENTDKSVANLTDAEADRGDIFNDIISEAKRHDVSIEEIDHFEAFLATSALPVEDTPVTNDSLFAEGSLLAENATSDSITNTNSIDTLPADNASVSTHETTFDDIDIVTTALDTEINIDDDEFAEFAVYRDNPEDEAWRNNKVDTGDDKIIIETTESESAAINTPGTANTIASEKKPQAETVHVSKEQSPPASDTQTVNIPSLILDDLHAARTEQQRTPNTLWMIGSLLLMFTLVSQVAYHSRDKLSKNTDLRPWLIQMCEVLNCTLSQPYDIKQINIIGRDVRSHPSANKALIVSTTLINTATFVQPFPLLTMVFSDINGTKVAQRRFTPREYLSNTADLDTGMTPDMPVRIDLELVDPGKAAVNYEFRAEIDPRQTRSLI